MYIFGGIEYNERDITRRNSLYKMWMTIPKLSEICWEAVTHYQKDLHCFDRQTLHAEGIPDKFIDRLPPLRQSPANKGKHAPGGDTSCHEGEPKRVCSHGEL